MKQIGLTGSIGMGKSTTAAMLTRLHIPVFDADQEVHRLLGPEGRGVAPVLAAFPGTEDAAGGIDRKILAAKVFGDTAALRRLEAILHPKVDAARRRFLKACARQHRKLVILDVPLLFESGRQSSYDAVLLVSSPPLVQRQRVLARPGMSEERFRQILSRQLPDAEKRRRTPLIVETGLGKAHALNRLRHYLRLLENDSHRGIWGAYARNRLRYGNHRTRSRQR